MATSAVRLCQGLSNDDLVKPNSCFLEFRNRGTNEVGLAHQCRAVGILHPVVVVLNLLQTRVVCQNS